MRMRIGMRVMRRGRRRRRSTLQTGPLKQGHYKAHFDKQVSVQHANAARGLRGNEQPHESQYCFLLIFLLRYFRLLTSAFFFGHAFFLLKV